MLQTAVPDPGVGELTDVEVHTIAESLLEGDRMVVVFREPSSATPEQLRIWHGTVVPGRGKWARRKVKWVRYDEAGSRLMFPFPPSRKDVAVIDVIKEIRHVYADAGQPAAMLATSYESMTATQREQSLDATTTTTMDGIDGVTTATANAMGDRRVMSEVRTYSTDMVAALSRRLYPRRRLIVWVCMPVVECDELVENLEAEIVSFRSPTLAESFIRAHIADMLALVTSSLRNEFEREGICGPDLCALVQELRKSVPLPDDAAPGERMWPLSILATKTLPMGECVEACDIFIHALKSADTIVMTEISRRLAPPSVVWVTLPLSPELRDRIERELQFSLHIFDTTYRAFQFVLACPWNVAALVTDRCQHLLREGHITGVELGRRLKQLNLCRFRNPHLILLGLPELFEDASVFDHVVSHELSRDEQEESIFNSLARLAVEQQRHAFRVPGAVVFGRGAHTSFAPTFPSPFDVEVDGERMTFPNVEQFFQAAKHYGNPELFAQIRDSPSVHGALQLAWQCTINSREWNAIRDDVMMFALFRKFSQREFQQRLLLTGDKDIIHATLYSEDTYWGDGSDRGTHRGRNRLGEMLMSIRAMLVSLSKSGAALGDDALVMRCPLRPLNSTRRADTDTRRYTATNVFDICYDEVLGRGANGIVYKARDMFTNQIVAAKVATIAQADEALRREFQLLARVEDNNVVQVLHAELPDNGTATIFMEFMSGGSLEKHAEKFRLYEVAIRNCVSQILDGLDTLHRKYHIVHCDLKPGNVLMSGNTVKISDFGASAIVASALPPPPPPPPPLAADFAAVPPQDSRATPTAGKSGSSARSHSDNPLRGAAGTPAYMSRSRMDSLEASYADDIWAVGCIVVRLALGGPNQPWWRDGDMWGQPMYPLTICHRMLQEPHHPAIPAHLSPHAKAFVLRCFTPNELMRPTAEVLKKDPWFACDAAGMEPLEEYRRARDAARVNAATCSVQDTLITIGASVCLGSPIGGGAAMHSDDDDCVGGGGTTRGLI